MSGSIKITNAETGELLYQGEIIGREGPLVEAGMITAYDESDQSDHTYLIVIEP